MQTDKMTEWVVLNAASVVFIVKDWLILNIGSAGILEVFQTNSPVVDTILGWAIGLSIFVFNVVRILKWVQDIKEKKSKNGKQS